MSDVRCNFHGWNRTPKIEYTHKPQLPKILEFGSASEFARNTRRATEPGQNERHVMHIHELKPLKKESDWIKSWKLESPALGSFQRYRWLASIDEIKLTKYFCHLKRL